MSNSFTQLWLGSLAGIATYYLIETLYYEVKARINGRQEQRWVDELEEDTWEHLD